MRQLRRAARSRCPGSRPTSTTSAPSARASRAVSSPMPELPPITTTVCLGSAGPRPAVSVVEVVIIPPRPERDVCPSLVHGAADDIFYRLRADTASRPRNTPGLPLLPGAGAARAQQTGPARAQQAGMIFIIVWL